MRATVYPFVILLSASCGGGSAEEPGPELPVEAELPDSTWSGDVQYQESGANQATEAYEVTIQGNTILIDFVSGELRGVALDSVDYQERGFADWLGPDEQVIGTCSAQTNTLVCTSNSEQAVQVERTLSFFEEELVWSEVGSLGAVTYEREGTLDRVPSM